jgi:hypothetical protein
LLWGFFFFFLTCSQLINSCSFTSIQTEL